MLPRVYTSQRLAVSTSNRPIAFQPRQDALLSASAGVFTRALNHSSWDSSDGFTPALRLLDNVMSSYNASASGIVGRDALSEKSAET